MKKFLINIFIFAILMFLFNLLLIPVVSTYFDSDTYFPIVKEAPSTTHTILLADSHGLYFDNEELQKANIQNMSFSSDSYIDMFRKVQYSQKHYPLETIILTVDRHTLSPYRESGMNNYLSAKLESYDSSSYRIAKFFPLFDMPSLAIVQGLVFSKFDDALSFLRGVKNTDNQDWATVTNKNTIAKKRMVSQFPTSKDSDKLRQALLDIIAFSKEHGIRIIGLRYPITKEYFTVLNGKDYGAMKVLEDKGIPILDYETLYMEYPSMFSNEDHLNFNSGKQFTKQLLEDIQNF